MTESQKLPQLRIDAEFKSLLAPLTQDEYNQLEANIMNEGCREPLVVWQRIIIDGHNRYRICMKHGIPFRTVSKYFSTRDEAISWICSNQLGRRNLSEETKKYLIGKKYETDKRIGAMNVTGANQHTYRTGNNSASIPASHNKTAVKIGKENNISHNTVYKYGVYSTAIDSLKQKNPMLASMILDGKLKISHDNLLMLAKLSVDDLEMLYLSIQDNPDGLISYSELRHRLRWKPTIPKKSTPAPTEVPMIKQTPKYDPDAEISSLSLTIPTWISSMNRTKDITIFDNTTTVARKSLENQLYNLRGTVDAFLALIKEDNS